MEAVAWPPWPPSPEAEVRWPLLEWWLGCGAEMCHVIVIISCDNWCDAWYNNGWRHQWRVWSLLRSDDTWSSALLGLETEQAVWPGNLLRGTWHCHMSLDTSDVTPDTQYGHWDHSGVILIAVMICDTYIQLMTSLCLMRSGSQSSWGPDHSGARIQTGSCPVTQCPA